ncbi:alkaline phosphatase [Paludibacterium paludis]|uniref:Alkaline phosphatase n=1 Tax=Paludibacterium paludis TaxID=1225769 RepID=A0A918P3Q4_9NEIS|nr:alkaline phosphatase [Paludibacterium paludis]GGY17618.1 alkaline phosphatase [Paludibacterium paludis]
MLVKRCCAILLALWGVQASAQAIYPIDRATMVVDGKFDFKVEFDGVVDPSSVTITVNGQPYEKVLGAKAAFLPNEDNGKASSYILRDISIKHPGKYEVVATAAGKSMKVNWEVYATGPRTAKNVILFIGDGMTVANRTAARVLSQGIKEGKYMGKLSFDDMPRMALIGTSGVESLITDSANSMSAYTTGHKSSNNALGVYASRAKNNLDHPKVETIAELVKRKTGMAVGIVTDAEVEDATPAGMVAHTRRRSDKSEIAEWLFLKGADVVMGGGSAYFLPKSTPGSKRKDDNNLIDLFKSDGFAFATTATELKSAVKPDTRKLLGLFNTGNMDGSLDRFYLKGGTVKQFPDQPDLTEMTRKALEVLSRNKDGFVLLVEAGLIDKASHPLDWERSVYDTIMLSNAVKIAKDFAAKNNDTLVMVTPDHTHGLSLVGTIDDNAKGTEMRDKIGVYEEAGYPNYPAPDKNGYPPSVDVSKRLAMFYGNFPDYYETFHPKLDEPFAPTVKNDKGQYVANEAYKNVPGAVLRVGNLPRSADTGTHTADDGVLTAMGPGSERIHGFMDNTEVFRTMVEALGLGYDGKTKGKTPAKPATRR